MTQEITLLAPATTRDSETGEFDAPGEFATLFSSITALGGRDLEQAQQIVAEVTHEVAFPYLPGVTSDMTVAFGARRFIILAVTDPDESQAELRLMCKERNAEAI